VFWFQAAFGIGFFSFGRFIDRVGARIGYAVAGVFWTVGHLAQALVTTTLGFAIVRIPLAFGESGSFPASLSATREWFPQHERALAIGIFTAGTSSGAILAPLIVPVITLTLNWQMAFIITGLFTVAWLAVWIWYYRSPREHLKVSPRELAYIEADPAPVARPVAVRQLLAQRATWAFVLGRFFIDSIWYTFLFWLPDFFSKQYGIDLKNFGPPLVVVYVMADLGSVSGGWGSSVLLKRGVGLNKARKIAMFACAMAVVPVAFAINVHGLWASVLLIGLAMAGHQGFSANLYALPSDVFPRWASSSVVGLGGLGGSLGGMIMAQYSGWILQTLGSYQPIFYVAACAYLVALLTVHIFNPRYEPVALAP